MRLAVAFLLGAAVAAGAWRATAHVFAQPLFARRNFRGIDVPVGVGVLLAVTAVAVESLFSLYDRTFDEVPIDRAARLTTLVVAIGFSMLGLFDDLAAEGDDRGFRGHLRAMATGRLTTGGLKLVGGGLLSIVVASVGSDDGTALLLVDAALIATGANLGNLFDRAPGRTTKVGLLVGAVLVLAAGAHRPMLTGVVVVLGAALGLIGPDLRERLMLGDAGSNVLGAVVATGAVLTTSTGARVAALVVVVALNIASEKVSFSRVIDSVGPLRAIDRLGRRPWL
jgi:UDP-GlcNAc:undecaprenyl-phosphate GlcNAc-1-phosphate transferase